MPLSLYTQKKKRPQQQKKHKPGKLDLPRQGNLLHVISLGCPRNRVDTEVMLGLLLQRGLELTPLIENADYILINTCGFLEAARQEALDVLAEAQEFKKKGAKVIVTGCMVQSHQHEIKEKFDDIDFYLGSGDVEGIVQAVNATHKGEMISSSRSYLEAGDVPRVLSTQSHTAYLKIAEGCKKRCAYCIIPKIKGPLKSKPVAQILKERDALLDLGVQEIILIAQDLGDYGKDTTTRNTSLLVPLLKEFLNTERTFWLRLLYLYPDEITDELIELMETDQRILPYLDIPIQHINDQVLQRMRRTTTKEEIETTIKKLRTRMPNITLRTSLMVGFPQETDEEFEELVTFVKRAKLDNVGVFKYSKEKESASYALEGHLTEEVKEERWHRLMQEQEKVQSEKLSTYIGKTLPVLIEHYHPETEVLLVGRHAGQCPEIDGCVLLNDWENVDAFGKFYSVEITDVAGYDLVGKVVERLELC